MSDWWSADPVADSKPQSSPYAGAISKVESGGRYDAMGPATRTGDRAHGRYQVMGANIGPWTREVFGQEMSPQQFLASPEAQDAVFNAKFGSYVQKYGPEGAAKAWFAGERGMNNPNARDVLGTSVTDYARKFNGALAQQPQAMTFAPEPPPQQETGNWWDADPAADQQPTFDDRFRPSQAGNEGLQAGLQRKAAQMTTGPQLAPMAQHAIEARNTLSGAQQGTTPHADQYGGKIVSTETFESDSGDLLYRDPATGQVKPTDAKTQVALRDPKDGVIKVYDRSADTNESGVVGASRVLAPGLGAGAVTARPAIAVASKEIVPKASEIMATAKPYYKAFKEEAGQEYLTAAMRNDIASRLRDSLSRVNLTEEMAGAPARSAIKMLEGEAPMSLDELQRVKRMAGRGFGNTEKDVRDGAAAISGEISRVISEVSKNAARNLKTADEIHSTAMSVQDLQRKEAVAGLRAGRAGYGGNSVNSMRQVLSPIVQRAVEGKMTGFKPDEIAAMREIVEGTPATNALRLVGQASPTKGIMNTGAGAAGGAFALGPFGAVAIPAIGAASNKLATFLTGKQIDQLKTLVAKRSPAYAEAVKKATERFERAQMELINDPSPNRFAAYLSASRAMTAGLQRDGIQVSVGDLIRGLQGPVKSAADDEQPKPEGVGHQ